MTRKVDTDVDIDVSDRDSVIASLNCILGRIDRPDGSVDRHPTGVYFQDIPVDPFTGISTMDYRIAKDYGYFKIDFLNVNMYEGIRDEDHLSKLLEQEPDWQLFEYEEITENLFHLKGHSKLLKKFKPKSVEDLSMILAIVRPAKSYLQNKDWNTVKQEVWTKVENSDTYQFKKSHALAYSLAAIVHLNLFVEQLSQKSPI